MHYGYDATAASHNSSYAAQRAGMPPSSFVSPPFVQAPLQQQSQAPHMMTMTTTTTATGGGPPPPRRRFRGGGDYDADDYAPRRKVHGQRAVDFYAPAIEHVRTRLLPRRTPYSYHVPPHEYYTKDAPAACYTPYNPSTALCTQWANTSFHPDARLGRVRVPLYSLTWAPNARRLLCATSRGEFLLFNGHSFGLEVKTVAHEDSRACRATVWGPRSDLILSGDDAGKVKMWLPNLVLVAEFDSGHRAVRELSWAPLETKFCTAGQDGAARVWDTNMVGTSSSGSSAGTDEEALAAGQDGGHYAASTSAPHDDYDGAGGSAAHASSLREEVKLEGHGSDVTTVHWHPVRSLIATGSMDTQCRLWDPRTAARGSVAVLYAHSQAVTCVRWHPDGRTLLSASKDGTIRLWDIRKTQPELIRFKGHIDAVEKVEWHPCVPELFASTGLDGSLVYWVVNECDGTAVHGVLEAIKDAATVEAAHETFRDKANPVFTLAWSPLGNVMATCSTEVKYWTRNKPGALEERARGGDEDILDDDAGLL